MVNACGFHVNTGRQLIGLFHGYDSAGYTIDRWALRTGAALKAADGGIEISVSDSGECNQPIDHGFEMIKGKTFTISYLTADNVLVSKSGVVPANEPSATARYIIVAGELNFALAYSIYTKRPYVYFYKGNGTSEKIAAVKLELGPVQTLAHQDAGGNWVLNDPPPNRALELAKCQRYFVRLSLAAYGSIGIGQAFTTTRVRMFLPLPQPMRATPSLNATPGNVFQLVESVENSGEKTYLASFRTNFIYLFQSGLAIEFIPQNSTPIIIGKTYIIRAGEAPAYIDISSDL